ncbi:MAG: response regulator transcription factor [Rhodospirillaceae bacterium]|nr:MAG: response regulator transcription factor [Rhodospirillaceae bacterium]
MLEDVQNTRILVVEDDDLIRDVVGIYLSNEGYQVTSARNGREMRAAVAATPPDLVLMDLRLPGEDGFMLTRYLREHHDVGIIILTARSETTDRVAGLECGADDYIVKPFAERELLARIRSVLRRIPRRPRPPTAEIPVTHAAVCFHGCELDAVAGRFRSADGDEIPLTHNEARLLEHMVRHIGRVMSREDLMAAVLQRCWDPCDRSIDVLVTRLRQKIETDPKRPRIIRTMRGTGYLLSADSPDRHSAAAV